MTGPGAGEKRRRQPPAELSHGAIRGTIAAMAMTGMRTLTVDLGIVEETPPRAILRQRAPGLLRRIPCSRRRAAIELAHWVFGAVGGATFAAIPEGIRLRTWTGPAYGLALWAGFEAGIAPGLGLAQARQPRTIERLGLAADHLLYGFVLSELRRRPRR